MTAIKYKTTKADRHVGIHSKPTTLKHQLQDFLWQKMTRQHIQQARCFHSQHPSCETYLESAEKGQKVEKTKFHQKLRPTWFKKIIFL